MYNLLVVDDEEIAIRGIVEGIDWSALPFANVYSALDAEEAKQIFSEHPVHIMISDIDMPSENGIELLAWVNANSPQTETVFLTGHADFKYAQQAIQLDSFDYLLKPIDHDLLKECVARALRNVQEREQDEAFRQTYEVYHEQWSRQLPLLIERFWQDVINRRIADTAEQMESMFALYGLRLNMAKPIVPVLISIEEWKREWSARDEEIMTYALKNAAEEILLRDWDGHVIREPNGMLFALLYAPQEGYKRLLEERCAEYIRKCGQYLYSLISCYIGVPAAARELPATIGQLSEMEWCNIGRTGTVFHLSDYNKPASLPLAAPNWPEWSALIEQGKKQELLLRIEEVFHQLQVEQVDHSYLAQFYFGLVHLVFQSLQKRSVSTAEVYPQGEWRDGEQAMKSLGAMKVWTRQFVGRAAEILGGRDKEVSVTIAKVQRYIEENLHLDMNREELAGHVYLNPAYLSRLFRKETGKSLTDFMVDLRMAKARTELERTNIKISDVAVNVGYSNFSHFSKQFKRTSGLTPQEYRKKYRNV
ncbi:helix-turn-helix domain-containing protein [Paenibacillus tarimensis]